MINITKPLTSVENVLIKLAYAKVAYVCILFSFTLLQYSEHKYNLHAVASCFFKVYIKEHLVF